MRFLCLFLLFLSVFSQIQAQKEKHYSPLSNLNLIESLVDKDSDHPGFVPLSFRESMAYGGYKIDQRSFYEGFDLLEQKFNDFCRNFQNSSENAIPPIIHLIWIGSPPPRGVELSVASWKKYHPNWDVKLWTDEDIESFTWVFPRAKYCFDNAKIWAEKADFLRLEILYQYGGIYSDADLICLKSFDDLIKGDLAFFAGIFNARKEGLMKNYIVVANGLIGSKKSHPILKRAIEISKTEKEAPKTPLWKRGGPGALRSACLEALYQNQEEKMVLFPCSYFYPMPCEMRAGSPSEILNTIRPESFSIHIGEMSWNKHRKEKN